DEDLVHWRFGQPERGHPFQLLVAVRHAGTKSTHREAGADHHWQVVLVHERADLVHRAAHRALRNTTTDRTHDLLETLPVLTALDRADVRTDQLHTVSIQHTPLGQFHRGV